MKLKTIFTSTALMAGLSAGVALAEYPERPINMIIPYGAGGATDISARTIAEPLGTAVGKPLIMANVTGAGGATGSVAVQNAKPDGYTMLFARVGSHSVNPAMKATLPYTLDDFRFVTVYEINPVACAVRPDSGIKSMEDLIAQVGGGGGDQGIRHRKSADRGHAYPATGRRGRCNRGAEWHGDVPVHQLVRAGELCGQRSVDAAHGHDRGTGGGL